MSDVYYLPVGPRLDVPVHYCSRPEVETEPTLCDVPRTVADPVTVTTTRNTEVTCPACRLHLDGPV